jgi:hypothetical protein
VHRNNILIYIQQVHVLQRLFYLTTALHVSGVTITHLQEHKTTVTTASSNRYTVLLSAAIVGELELIWVCCGWCTLVGTDLKVIWNWFECVVGDVHQLELIWKWFGTDLIVLWVTYTSWNWFESDLELIWVCCGCRTPPTTHSNQFQPFHDSSRQQYGVTVTRCCSYSCFVLLKMGDSDARNM